MLRFAHPEYLTILYFTPLLIALFWFSQRKRKLLLQKFADKKLHNLLFPMKSRVKPVVKFTMVFLAIVFIIIALANPQVGSKIEEIKHVGIDVYILLDVSQSMKAEDIKPSRLEKAKHDIAKLIQRLQGDRIGLIVFAGEAYVQFPLTTDYSAANLFLNAVDYSSVPQPGTAIGPAIELALKSFKKDENTKKAIVIITDGEDHEGDLDKAIEHAKEKNVSIYAIGLGSPAGVPIPIYNRNGVRTGYKKDKNGKVVLTKLDEDTLREITSKADGKYYRATNTDDALESVYKDLSSYEGTEFGTSKVTDYEDRFYYLLIPALLLLLIEFFISEKKSKLLMKLERETNI